jgi:hypothetical protein
MVIGLASVVEIETAETGLIRSKTLTERERKRLHTRI